MPNTRVSAIILDQDKILLMRRIKNKKEYYVLPGGSVENDESLADALTRELREETGLTVKIDKELYQVKNDFDTRTQHIYLIKEFTGKLELGKPEIDRQSPDNHYELQWHPIKNLGIMEFYPEEIKNKIEKDV